MTLKSVFPFLTLVAIYPQLGGGEEMNAFPKNSPADQKENGQEPWDVYAIPHFTLQFNTLGKSFL